MKTYKRIFEDCPGGGKQVAGFVCNENPALTITIQRGSISHNRPTGYDIRWNGRTDWTRGIASYLTLAEAKEAADYHFPGIGAQTQTTR